MKTVLSLLIIGVSTASFAQNRNNNSAIQQQSQQFNTILVQDNNVGAFANVQQVSNPNTNVSTIRLANRVSYRSNRTSNLAISNVINPERIYSGPNGPNGMSNNFLMDNVGENKVVQVINTEKVKQEKEVPQLSLNLNIDVNLPSINLNRVKQEKKTPKRLDDFRIKTGSGSSSGGGSHTRKKSKNATYKKVIKSIKYCWRKNFKQNIKFQSSNDCFLF